ncbi:MAG: hypothetical protein EP340_00830 [Alphaproteobacteria bacterium]|nr:MAG: hypothetical protein EP340_00830 [Alphaproteobacteria bacterium]
MALERLRKLSKSPVIVVLLGLIALSFVIVGNVGDTVRSTGGRAVATVGGDEIGIQEFYSAYDRQTKQIGQQIGQPVTPELAMQMGLVDQVLGSLVNRTALSKHARSLGVVGSDKAVKRELFKIEAFQGGDKRFDPNQYQLLLNSNNIDQAEFESGLRSDVVIEQMFDMVRAGITPPKGLAELLFRYQAETRGAEYIMLSPDLVGAIEDPGDEALKEFYEANAAMFTEPELRQISYLDIKPADFTDKVLISEEDIAALYDRLKPNYITPESRMVKQIFGSEEMIKEAKSRIDAGESFNDVAESLGFRPQEYNLGSVMEKDISDKPVADVVFGMTEPGITDPIQGGLSWSLVELLDIEPEVVQTLDDVREDLRKQIAERNAQDLVFETLDVVEEEIASGTPMADIAQKVGLTISVIDAVSSEGKDAHGLAVADLPADPKFLEEAFATVVGFASDVLEVSEGEYVTLQVDEITPSVLKPFEDVRANALVEWRKVQRANRLEELALSLVERGNKGEAFAEVGDSIGRGVLTVPTPIKRGEPTDLLSSGMVRQLFSSQVGNFVYGNMPEGDSLIVARLTSIDIPNSAAAGQIIDSFQDQIGTQMSRDVQDLYVSGLLGEYSVKRNQAAIDQVVGIVPQSQ